MKASWSKRAIAFGLLGAGVIAIFAVNMARQNEQTEAHARVWVGGQWDVARNCLTGTPIREDEGATKSRLDRMLIAAIAGENEWPARCVPLLRSLDVDRSLLRRDPGDALARLTVLAPRVIGDRPIAVREARARAHELASAIATLDRAMPSGEEYRREEIRDAVPIDVLASSFDCEPGPQPACPNQAAYPNAVVGCEGDANVWAEREANGWRGAVCTGECTSFPPLEAETLRLAIHDGVALAIVTHARSDLTFARVLRENRWSDPIPIARGVVKGDARGFRIDTCGATITSRDGLRWR